MPTDFGERMAKQEADMETVKIDLGRHRGHISELLTFKSRAEGAMGTVKWLAGMGLVSNLAMLLKLFLGG
mgnify:CR=1 FL=1